MANSNGWGDGASNNDIGWGQGADNAIGWGAIYADSWAGATDIVGTPAVDPDAQAFITAASITDPTQQSAINQLVVDLKGYGIWTKFSALYPFCGSTASQHKWNLKDPRDLDVAFRLVFNGGWTHSVNGATPNGTNGYANTYFNPTTQSLSTTSQHLSYYSRTNVNENAVEIGVISGTNNNFLGLYVNSTVGTRTSLASSARYNNTSAPIDTRGLFTSSRINGTDIKVYVNGSTQATQAVASTGNDNFNMYIGTYGAVSGQTLWSSKQCAFASIGDGLTDTEAANFYTAVQAFQTTLGRSIGTQTVSDADAQAFVTNAGIVDQVEANAVNNLVIGLKADGLWTKMKALYPFVGGTSTTNSYNLKNTAQYQITWAGGVTHSANGVQFGGVNGYGNTNLTPSTALSLNSTHLSVYSRTNSNTNAFDIGVNNYPNYSGIVPRWSDNNYAVYINDPSGVLISNLDSRGFYLGNRQNSNDLDSWKNSTKQVNGTTVSGALPIYPIYIGAWNQQNAFPNYYSNKELAFASIGDGLTDTEATNFYNRVQTFNTALARQV